jgi:hypothetical protein
MENILRIMPEGVMILDQNMSNVKFANKACYKLFMGDVPSDSGSPIVQSVISETNALDRLFYRDCRHVSLDVDKIELKLIEFDNITNEKKKTTVNFIDFVKGLSHSSFV